MTKKYDTLRFELCDPYEEKEPWLQEDGKPGSVAVKIFVNDQELNALLVAWEDKVNEADRPTNPVAWYGHNEPSYLLEQLQSEDEDARTYGVPVNRCSQCGFEGCWEVRTKIRVTASEVVWHDFTHSRGLYSYDGFEFHFERHAYDGQIEKLKGWAKKYGY